ncbi:mannose-6-phosphate isomerase class I [Pullulanibacillus pueri]|uniref:Mannose-6-phosphate isomerase n=1 Tax=Pullulanibacillus pueri TaxID=1437324 RepID=A0A8J3A0M8_9BACL|nr:class I mannose-6-phosphate isomerase [Pullulanibacillus pueri]MBM7684224.1 mannose-6-phosphate isomerase class I [Pullulanibacillus pueri]GGH88996.1 mannose-6-phosphate isomerase [Pullulanibacillus pueri]
MTSYEKYPEILISNAENTAWKGYPDIVDELLVSVKSLQKEKTVVMIDCYPGVRYEEIERNIIAPMKPTMTLFSDDLTYPTETIDKLIEPNLTDDRVFGVLSTRTLNDFFDPASLDKAREKLNSLQRGLVVIYGVGAQLVVDPDLLVYADLTRWEIQKRYNSSELPNWKSSNHDEDPLRKFKRGYFIEWRAADKHKKRLFHHIDYLLDTNELNAPKMVDGHSYLEGLKQTVNQPFRVIPHFVPGVWGGQWMKEILDLDRSEDNYAWCFDGVIEENGLRLRYGDVAIVVPAINLVFQHPIELLGDKVHARFGTEFPIRFDFLDTMDGQNLSLQVHPLTEYIQETFGMHYTQDESYYMLDAKEDATVYLGVKDDVNKEEMLKELHAANQGDIIFDDEKYINQFPAKKHDHFLIPAGTVHCSGKNAMVLEISATPYIFTFKLWDWGRLGLDGLPRPVHLEHGEKVIQWDRDEKWVRKQLINRIEKVAEGEGWIEEKTGLHEREFIETRRHWFSSKVLHHTNDSVNVLNLIEGEEAIVESPDHTFEPFIVHYAETFFIPENVKHYTIRPYGRSNGKTIATIKAYVRV